MPYFSMKCRCSFPIPRPGCSTTPRPQRKVTAASILKLLQGYRARGDSTLTQQLIKRLFFAPKKNLKRKLSEALLAT